MSKEDDKDPFLLFGRGKDGFINDNGFQDFKRTVVTLGLYFMFKQVLDSGITPGALLKLLMTILRNGFKSNPPNEGFSEFGTAGGPGEGPSDPRWRPDPWGLTGDPTWGLTNYPNYPAEGAITQEAMEFRENNPREYEIIQALAVHKQLLAAAELQYSLMTNKNLPAGMRSSAKKMYEKIMAQVALNNNKLRELGKA